MSRYDFPTSPVAHPGAIVAGDKYRFTVLTDGLIRYEWADDGKFEDRASTFAICRKLAVPDYYLWDRGHVIEIITQRFHLVYNKKEFSSEGFAVQLKGPIPKRWTYGQYVGNLGGTTRTLDMADGRIGVEPGVLSREGIAVIDDSRTMLFESDGWVGARKRGNRADGYIFLYGHDYRDAMRAFYAVSGSQPLLPRYALGNWWSRYHPYNRREYLDLIDHFKRDKVPMAVAVLDMDWHKVNIPPAYGNGWTGYSWNRDLFPDPQGFLEELHERKLHTTLNVHPADGIRGFEDQYHEVAKYLGLDPSKNTHIQFDCCDRKFMDAYFDIVHHEHEKEGVDFWWVDWQQGNRSRIEGIDPLWVLNHFHFLDNGRGRQRPLILSRFAGPGSHRYQVGFSGDTVMTWASLDFQSEFTATASNIGYGWWSHDIGGHMHGYKDDELTTRWVQLGCFSPILRLHSSNNIFNTREPWTFNAEAYKVIEDTLRFRHRLIPYLYTMNARAASDDEPLIQPMYWDYPETDEAYNVPNQYRFGSELIVAPITRSRDPSTHLGSVKAWLPPLRFVDIFTGVVYDGDREILLHRPLSQTPVLASEGAIVPLDATPNPENGAPNPEALEILLVVGADGWFELVEDNGTGTRVDDGGFRLVEADGNESGFDNVRFSYTPISYKQATGVLRIGPTSPPDASIPKNRDWVIRLIAYTPAAEIRCHTPGSKKPKYTTLATEPALNGTIIKLGAISSSQACVIELGAGPQLDVIEPASRCWPLIYDANMSYDKKEAVWWTVMANQPVSTRVSRLQNMGLRQELLDAILELILADSRWGS
ncbi:glycoside hydrolase family 31 protein [Lepidopterella palustris CBS 459.81]|uniref:alpha-glucosidase n=1 Tax=Lepidopterella palustris CBS 459.81 TaxID=1314670 RepID=A0A8E2E0G3_9PEZI|nr:glycoside hydrolase family 31 protein [Lepidopterella palustris CBS 459.81]